MIYLQLFYTFFKIGLFGFGGGYAMLSMIQGEVVTRYGWVSSQEFTDIVAISQMTPGPIGINAATYVGFTSTGSVWGSIIATFAVVLPSFILMLTISKFFLKYQKHPIVESIFNGLRPAVVGLLASAALVLMNAENFGSPTEDTYSFVISIIIFLIAFIGTRKYKANPILMIIACGIAGLLLYHSAECSPFYRCLFYTFTVLTSYLRISIHYVNDLKLSLHNGILFFLFHKEVYRMDCA